MKQATAIIFAVSIIATLAAAFSPRPAMAGPAGQNDPPRNSVPSFASSSGLAYEATAGILFRQTLPAAIGGDGALTYTLSNTGLRAPCISQSGPSGSGGVGGSSDSLLPSGITYVPPGATDTHGGTITVATNTAAMSATCFRLVAQDADSLSGLNDVGILHFSIAVLNDYDGDNDGLIDVNSLAKLNAIRWDLNGDGNVAAVDATAYKTAFPNAMAGMGCKPVDHDDNTVTAKTPVCTGYELTGNLDFDENNDGSITSADDDYWNGGKGWTPIGNAAYTHYGSLNADTDNPFTATFAGNNKTISNLFINSTDGTPYVGLFGVIGKCNANGNGCEGKVKNLGLINASVTRNHNSSGGVGSLAGSLHGGEVISCYATGSVSHPMMPATSVSNAGGLIGVVHDSAKVTACYATANVSSGATNGGTGRNRIGGLVGRSSGMITASYAAGSVRNTGRGPTGGLVGYNNTRRGGVITASYAVGAVNRSGGLAGSSPTGGTGGVVSGYWDTGTTGRDGSAGTTDGKTTRELQSPTDYTGIYASWNVDLDGDSVSDNPWDFGANRQYPALKYGGLDPYKQRQLTIRSDSWNAPVVGEPIFASADTYTVRATLNIPATAAVTTAWQWQHSTGGTEWTNATGTGANNATYYPVAEDDDAATDDVHDEGKYLRAKATFTYTVSGSSIAKTLTTANTAKTLAAPAASAAVTAVPIVGEKLRYALPTGATRSTGWRWLSCAAARMTDCALRQQSNSILDAHTEYTPAAGTDTDVGKYLRAYVYYSDSANSNAWTRAQTPILGPVVAAPATP